jgi:hypothetical protein
LISDLRSLAGPTFDPGRVHPHVREFYEHTARFELGVTPRWSAPFRLAARLFVAAYAGRWGQLELPAGPAPLSNEILALGDHGRDGTLWVRRYEEGDRTLYVSRYDVVGVHGEPHVRISFPVPGGAWVVLFRVVQRGGGILLTEDGGPPAGLYLLPADGPARYVAWLREEIEVVPTDRGAWAEHRFRWWGLRFLTLGYALPEASSATAGTA